MLLTVLLMAVLHAPCGLAQVSGGAEADGLAHAIADRYGYAQWRGVETLEFVFNVEQADGRSPRPRRWVWGVQQGVVTRLGPGREVAIGLHDDPAGWTQAQAAAHLQFIKDTYWLLFPFQLVWSDPVVTDAGPAPLPRGAGTARKVVAQWPDEGGYTPGDAYDLFLDGDGVIREWTFRRRGRAQGPSMTFLHYEQVGPLLLSLDRQDDRGFRLFFTDLVVTLRGGERVTSAGPR